MLIHQQLGIGAVPACAALYYRLTIPETPRYTFDVARDIEKGRTDVTAYMTGKHEGKPDEVAQAQARKASVALEVPKASWKDFFRFYGKWKNGYRGDWLAGVYRTREIVQAYADHLKDPMAKLPAPASWSGRDCSVMG